jgi:putative PIN family toxin of toxin-antitoxin system
MVHRQRVIFDSNIWVSFAIGKRLDELKMTFTHPNIEIFACRKLLWEVSDATQKPKLSKYISPDRREMLLELIEACHFVNIEEEVFIARDPNDNYLLDLSAKVNADFLVTGDNDLLVLKNYRHTAIVTFNSFLSIPLLN